MLLDFSKHFLPNFSLAFMGALHTDAIGNCYLTGSFNGTATFGTKTLSSFGEYGYDIFIAKYDNAGNYLWVQKAGGIDTDAGTGIITDATGNSYLTGYFKGEAAFGSSVLTSNGGYDMFIAKYDNAGNCLWAQKAGGTNDDQGNGTTTDANGNCYVTGCFNGTATFDTTTLTSYGSQDIFIAKYDNAGNYLWTKKTGGVGYDNGNGISESTNENIYVTGNIGSGGNFGGLNLIGGGGFITKIAITSLNISAPTGSEIWQTNSSHNITWNSIDDGNIKIEITTNDGKNWLTLQNSVKANLGNYTMTVPPLPNSSECKIMLTSLSYGNMDTSSVFTITSVNVPNLTINSPNAKEKWNAGSRQNIKWALTGSIENVKLEYTTNNGNSWGTIINSTLAASENYSWVVPNTPSSLCRIRVADVTNPVLNDISDTLFTIPNNITITTPGGGEKWKSVSSKYITWMSPGIVYVNLFYSTNNGKDWISIANNITASFGGYTWNVPNLSSSECRIKLEEATDTSVFNISSGFSIWQPIVSTQTPTIGQINQNFGLTNIDFSAFILVTDAITTTFYPYEAPQVGALPNGVFGISHYYWFITSTSVSFFNGVISVPLSSFSGIIDTTKLVWLKRTNPGDSWIDIGGNVLAGNLLSTIELTSFSEFAIGTTDGVDEVSAELNALPKEFVLEQNYPNPFNPTTTILYVLPFESNIKLVVYNLIGEVVKELLDTRISAGYQEVRFDAENLSSGIYFYTLYATSLDGQQNYQSMKKMLLLK